MSPPEVCPNCGHSVPPRARACPHCGADEQTGWSDQAVLDRLDVPSEEFDYESYLEEEFKPEPSKIRPTGISLFWWITAVVVLLLLLKFGLF